ADSAPCDIDRDCAREQIGLGDVLDPDVLAVVEACCSHDSSFETVESRGPADPDGTSVICHSGCFDHSTTRCCDWIRIAQWRGSPLKPNLWRYRFMVMEPYETHTHQGAEAVTDAQHEHSDQSGHEAHNDHVDHNVHPGHNGHPGHDDHLRHADQSEHSGRQEHSGHAGHSGHGGHAHHVAQFRPLFW